MKKGYEKRRLWNRELWKARVMEKKLCKKKVTKKKLRNNFVMILWVMNLKSYQSGSNEKVGSYEKKSYEMNPSWKMSTSLK